MGLELENPQAFLEQAAEAIRDYEEVKKSLAQKRELEKQTEKNLEALQKETREKTEKTIKARGDEIAATYDGQLRQIDSKLKKLTQQRERAKTQGVKGRIRQETEDLRLEIQELKRQLVAIMKQDHAPGICHTDLFYILYHPGSLPEVCGLLVAFLLAFLVIPLTVYYCFLSAHGTLALILIYLLDILVFGGLYVLLGNQTNGRHRDAIKEGIGIRRRIRTDRRKIRTVTKGIRSDLNEDGYHLEEFDDEIARTRQDRNGVIAQKQSAQNTFDNVTRNIIKDEIETAAKPRLEELTAKLSEATEERGALETREKYLSLKLSKDYEQYLGKKHMNEKDLGTIGAMLAGGQAVSIIDAVTKLEHPDKTKPAETAAAAVPQIQETVDRQSDPAVIPEAAENTAVAEAGPTENESL